MLFDVWIVDYGSGKTKRIAKSVSKKKAMIIQFEWDDSLSSIVLVPLGFRLPRFFGEQLRVF
jgi:hypothetical protein